MNKALDRLPLLVREELQAANAEHEPFHSAHEGYAVLLEEVEEARDELIEAEFDLQQAWKGVRCDDLPGMRVWVSKAERAATRLAAEAIQAAAVARKLLTWLERESDAG